MTSYAGLEQTPSISPDGDQVAFSWNGPNQDNFDIYVQLVGAGRPLQLTSDPAEDSQPVWSPDGRYIAFLRQRSRATRDVIRVPALGGSERKLGEAFGNRSHPSLSWSPDGKFLAIVDRTLEDQAVGSIFLLSVETGEKRRLTSPSLNASSDHGPAFSPDGRWLAFIHGAPHGNVHVLGLTGDGSLDGEPRPLTFTFGRSRIRGLDWSADGRSIVFSSDRAGSPALWRVSVSGGEPERLAVGGDNAMSPSISRQGNRLVYEQVQLVTNIWRTPGISADGPRAATRFIASSTRQESSAHFSPDGSKIAFESARSGSDQIWISDGDGLNPVQLTSFEGPSPGVPRWSPDGRWVAFDLVSDEIATINIHVVSADGGAPRQLTSGPYRQVRASWSRDGRWVYFGSNRSGDWQIWKVPFEGGEPLQAPSKSQPAAFGGLGSTAAARSKSLTKDARATGRSREKVFTFSTKMPSRPLPSSFSAFPRRASRDLSRSRKTPGLQALARSASLPTAAGFSSCGQSTWKATSCWWRISTSPPRAIAGGARETLRSGVGGQGAIILKRQAAVIWIAVNSAR